MNAMENRTVMGVFASLAPTMTYLANLPIPGRDAKVMSIEARNRSRIMTLVNGMDSYVGQDNRTPLQQVVEKCYALGAFPALWAIEGVGKDLAEWHMRKGGSPRGILTELSLDPKWDGAWLMLHAGIGMGFARQPILALPASPSDNQVHDFALRFVGLCKENSRPGYAGAAIESLGLVSRFMRGPEFGQQLHRALSKDAPDAVGYFWRGAGRCTYFHPQNFLPKFGRPYRGLDMVDAEAPSPETKQALFSGMAWALTVVNMMSPEVMESVLETLADDFAGQPGFVNGVTCSVVMRYDTTPGDPLIARFMNHQPTKGGKLAGLWAAKIKTSCEFAIGTVHPALKRHQRLEEVFHYQSLPELIGRLGSGAGR